MSLSWKSIQTIYIYIHDIGVCLVLPQVASIHITTILWNKKKLVSFYMYISLLPVAALSTLSSTPIKGKEEILQHFWFYMVYYDFNGGHGYLVKVNRILLLLCLPAWHWVFEIAYPCWDCISTQCNDFYEPLKLRYLGYWRPPWTTIFSLMILDEG